ncbi:MAG: peroxide stress protein YaaA [Actinomycetales bacterium]|nr:peroxide stress protein YaaA [Actinomycetales bacterium]
MLILLPPSEGKSSPVCGPRLDLTSLSFPSLTPSRRTALGALTRLCRADVDEAAAVLGLGPTQRGEVGVNARLRREPCAPAIEVYTGVLYEALDASSLSPRARLRLDDSVAISSALWGLVRTTDLIPAYRLSGSVRLPRIGALSTVWRDPIGAVLTDADGLLLDLRSSAYASLGPVPRSAASRSATVRVLTERDGRRTVVSHSNKATKGHIVRALVKARRSPQDVDDLAHELVRAGFRVEIAAGKPRSPVTLDVILASS